MNSSLLFLPVIEADQLTMRSIATFVYYLDKGFYGNLFPDEDSAVVNILKALAEPGSDLGCGFVAYNASSPVGYVAFFPAQQKTTKNLATIKAMIDLKVAGNRQKFIDCTSFQQQLAPISLGGFYLNKIMVFPEFQGATFGLQIFNYYLREAKSLGLEPVFHVKKDNYSAIEFYKRQGFSIQPSVHEYVVCKMN